MDLQDFVTATLCQISAGVATAKNYDRSIAPRIGVGQDDPKVLRTLADSDRVFLVEFDVKKNNERKHMKTITNIIYPALAVFSFACLAVSPRAQAVKPPPDGGYPGFNTAEGDSALFSLSTGVANTALGWFSLKANAEGSLNTAVGTGTLLLNSAAENTATGAAALLSNTTGTQNTANGGVRPF
jgi:hypothetical protein